MKLESAVLYQLSIGIVILYIFYRDKSHISLTMKKNIHDMIFQTRGPSLKRF